jgi:hypothetical protein
MLSPTSLPGFGSSPPILDFNHSVFQLSNDFFEGSLSSPEFLNYNSLQTFNDVPGESNINGQDICQQYKSTISLCTPVSSPLHFDNITINGQNSSTLVRTEGI